MRTDFIQQKVDQGFGAGEIANALNLKKTSVEKVIRQLQGAGAAQTEPADRRQAEAG